MSSIILTGTFKIISTIFYFITYSIKSLHFLSYQSQLRCFVEDLRTTQNRQRGRHALGPLPPRGLLDASQRPQTPLRRLKTPPNASQMPQEASKTPSDGSKTPQEASKRLPRPSKIDFSSQHGPPKPRKSFKIYWKNNSSEFLH